MKLKKLNTMKHLVCALVLVSSTKGLSQTYNSTDYANQGDTVYVSKATLNTLNYDTTGLGMTWNYAALVGNSQTREVFANPTQTGYTLAQFSYIFNTSNVNLAQTNGQTIAIGSLSATNPYDYFKKTVSDLHQSASAYKVVIGSSAINVKNTYSTPDVIYKFPINMGNADSSDASYITNIPGVYYKNTQIHRVNNVVGTGTIITPYGTFSNALKMESLITQTDSISLNGTGYPTSTFIYKELKWLDASKKYPILKVRMDEVNTNFVTSSIEFLDNKIYYQPSTFFAYYPVCPIIGDTIQFQNLSTNSETYSWNFDDPTSGALNISSNQNPTHIFSSAGTYNVTLISYNGILSDTVTIPVVINQNLDAPTISINSNGTNSCLGDSISFSSTITNGGSIPVYQWYVNGNIVLGENASTFSSVNLQNSDTISCQLISSMLCLPSLIDTSNSIIVSILPSSTSSISITACNDYFWQNTGLTYSTSGTYTDTLVNSIGCDSIVTLNLTINPSTAPIPQITPSGNVNFCSGDVVQLSSDITSGITWSTGETSPTILVSTAGSYFVSYQDNGCLVSSAAVTLTELMRPVPTITPISDICDTAGIILLNQGLPSGGTYYVNSISTTSFDPALANLGSNTLTYTVIGANSCTGSVTTVITVLDCSSGAALVETNSKISIFPNPATNQIEIRGVDESTFSLSLIDFTGKEIGKFENTSFIDLSSYTNGAYFLKIISKKSESILTLIINH